MIEINAEGLKGIMEQIENPVVVDFFADWCGPCRTMAPMLEELSKEIESVDFYKLNVEDNPEVASEFGVLSIPSFLVIEKERWQVFTGAIPKLAFKNKLSGILGVEL